MEAMLAGDEDETQFGLREIVWAKIIGYPWWPAQITQLPRARSTSYRVDFFQDNSHAFVGTSKMAKYEDMRCDIDLHKHMPKGLRKAIAEADKLVSSNGTPGTACELPDGPVEDLLSNQKQLLQSPSVHNILQENITLAPIAQEEQHQISDQESNQSQEEQSEILQPTILNYSRQQRHKYVNTLLKKYRLTSIPKTTETTTAVQTHQNAAARGGRGRRRSGSGRHKTEAKPKSKMISKLAYQKHSFFYLLTRKIHSVLRDKQELSQQQKKDISVSLSRQLLAGEGGPETLLDLFKWICITPSATVLSFYQTWSTLQGQKEKSSNMTTEE